MCSKSRVVRLQILALKPNDIAYPHTFWSNPTPLTKFLIDHLLHVLRLSVRHITCEGNYILMHTCRQMYTCKLPFHLHDIQYTGSSIVINAIIVTAATFEP